jgi:hypothetical protein
VISGTISFAKGYYRPRTCGKRHSKALREIESAIRRHIPPSQTAVESVLKSIRNRQPSDLSRLAPKNQWSRRSEFTAIRVHGDPSSRRSEFTAIRVHGDPSPLPNPPVNSNPKRPEPVPRVQIAFQGIQNLSHSVRFEAPSSRRSHCESRNRDYDFASSHRITQLDAFSADLKLQP